MTTNRGFKFKYLKGLHGRAMKPAHYRVLVTLLDYARSDGSMAHPGVELLARDCCMHVETVTQALRQLCHDGYIVKTYQGGHQRGASSYSFAPPPQPSPQAYLLRHHNKAKITKTPASQQSPQTATSVDEQINGHGNDGPNDDPWGAPPEPDLRSGGSQGSESDRVELDTGSPCSPGDPGSTAGPSPVNTPRGTPEKLPPRDDDPWPSDDCTEAPCMACGEPVFRSDDYTHTGYLKWHSACAK